MTFEEKIKELLISNGMFDTQAIAVLAQAKDDTILSDFKGRWGHDVGDYPAMMTNVVWAGVKRIAVKWIDANVPEAWFRPMFATEM